jgi:hypothetical protein
MESCISERAALETEILPLAEKAGFTLDKVVAMPADNLMVVFRNVCNCGARIPSGRSGWARAGAIGFR